jgi:hypothetical protein
MQKGDLVKCREFSYEPYDPPGPYAKTWGRIGIVIEYDPKHYMALVVMQRSGKTKRIAIQDLQLLARTGENKKNLMKLTNLKYFDRQIYCDMDGVLVDFENPAVDRINQALRNNHLPAEMKELADKIKSDLDREYITLADLKSSIGKETQNTIRKLMQELLEDDEEWWANLPWLEEGKKLWEVISRIDKFPVILTTPMDQRGKKGSNRGKERWVKDNLKLHTNIVTDVRVIFSHNKYEYAIGDYGDETVLIDDFTKNIKKFDESGGYVVHHIGNTSDTLDTLEEISNGTRLGNRRILANDT